MTTKKIIRREVKNFFTDEQLHPLLARVYAARGVQSANELERGLEQLLPYTSLLGIDCAIACLATALEQQQHILIVGDFDADGATSTALAVLALKSLGAKNVSYLVPNRFEYGYGLTPEIVDVAAQRQPNLIITVDNGIASNAGVQHAKALGINVIITDHHLPGAELPIADAIVNPNQCNDPFLSKHLAGVGVIFYVMLALRSYLRVNNWFALQNIAEPNMAQFLDLVALGTVADVAVLDKNNRILVHQGLQRIRAGKARAGINALLEVAGRLKQNCQAGELGFVLGPRLNAAGRLDDMSLGIACLLTDDLNQARTIATQLDQLNRERQAIEDTMQQQALLILQKLQVQKDLPLGMCLFDPQWHQGVVGILAARIKDKWHRPVIAFAKVSDDELKGSARSIPGLHIRDTLEAIATAHPHLINKFGGHAMAAGVSIHVDYFSQFAAAFDAEVQKRIQAEQLQNLIHSDGELVIAEFSLTMAEMLQQAGPWGQGFPEPIFDGIFHLIEQRLVGQRHLKMLVRTAQDTTRFFDAIAFNIDLQQWPNHRCEKIHAAYRLDINEYRGRRDVQLIIEHLEAI